VAEGHEVLFTKRFLRNLQSLIESHHSMYPHNPPRDVFFEFLVQRAFLQSGWTQAQVVPTTPGRPEHDLLVGTARISVKSETGVSTKRDVIKITKLCTTEKDPWEVSALIQHTLAHLSRYDHILMLRAVWIDGVGIHYQLLEIPIPLLRLIADLQVAPARRKGSKSISGDVKENDQALFHVHFDGSDKKCVISKLPVKRCHVLLEWDYRIADI
jgi:hypothetical protein